MGIRAHPRLTSGKTSKGHHGTQSLGCAGQTVRPSLHSISQASAGKLSILKLVSLCFPSFDVRWRRSSADRSDRAREPPRKRTSRIYEYTPFCNGPGDVKSPRVIVTPPSSRFCPWLALRPPHYAVRRNGEPMLLEGTV